MEWIQVICNAVITFLFGLFLSKYLPTYMSEKGKNLATKEDIKEITEKTEEVKNEFNQSFEYFSSDVQFKYEFYYKQYSELYCKLYSIVIQSEYTRYLSKIDREIEIAFNDVPFIEVSPTNRNTITYEIKKGESPKVSKSVEKIETPISQFNKKTLCEFIIDKGEYATQELLKIAISYRYVSEQDYNLMTDTTKKEELSLIRDMVLCIVKDYNNLRKELKMEHNEIELKSGYLQIVNRI